MAAQPARPWWHDFTILKYGCTAVGNVKFFNIVPPVCQSVAPVEQWSLAAAGGPPALARHRPNACPRRPWSSRWAAEGPNQGGDGSAVADLSQPRQRGGAPEAACGGAMGVDMPFVRLSGMPLAAFNGTYQIDVQAPEANGEDHYVHTDHDRAAPTGSAHLYALPDGRWGLSSSFDPEASTANAFCDGVADFPVGDYDWQYCEGSEWKQCRVKIEVPKAPPAVAVDGLFGGVLDGTYELAKVKPLLYRMHHITGKEYHLYRQTDNGTWIISPEFSPDATAANAFCARNVPLPELPLGLGFWKYWDGTEWQESAVEVKPLHDHVPAERKAASSIQAAIRGRITRRLLRDQLGADRSHQLEKLEDARGAAKSPPAALEAFMSGCKLLKAEIPKAALPMFMRALELGYALPERCHNGAALAYLQDSRPEMALRQLDKALAANPNDARVIANRRVVVASNPDLVTGAIEWKHPESSAASTADPENSPEAALAALSVPAKPSALVKLKHVAQANTPHADKAAEVVAVFRSRRVDTSKMSRKEQLQYAIQKQVDRQRTNMLRAQLAGDKEAAAKHKKTVDSLERQRELSEKDAAVSKPGPQPQQPRAAVRESRIEIQRKQMQQQYEAGKGLPFWELQEANAMSATLNELVATHEREEKREIDEFLGAIHLDPQETSKIERIGVGDYSYLKDNAEDMAIVEAVFAACDADGDGEI
eukprot:SAG22_NODE_1946_length_3279_cov_1.645283_1_plen_707_part_10